MNILTESKEDRLQQILAIYNNRIVVHEHLENNQLGVGQPLTVQSAKGIFSFIRGTEFEEKYSFRGIIPPNVLKFSSENVNIVWTTEPSIRQLHFKEDLPINSGYYPVPRLLWRLKQDNLDVFALKGDENQLSTKLYQAPFLNVYSSGNVCMGSSDYKTKSRFYEMHIQRAESGFFNSVFTHTNTDHVVKSNIVDVMNEMAEKKSKAFDTSLLVEIGKTIKDII